MLQSFVQRMGFAAILLLLPTFSYAQGTLYKWTDSRGNVHYTNTPTNTTATAVDNTLPPASSFKSPTPPPEAAETASPSSESAPTPGNEGGTAPANETGTPQPETTADGSLSSTGETTGGEPAPAPSDESAPDAQQEVDGKPQLPPE